MICACRVQDILYILKKSFEPLDFLFQIKADCCSTPGVLCSWIVLAKKSRCLWISRDTKVQSQLDSPQYFKLDQIKVKILVPGRQACEDF